MSNARNAAVALYTLALANAATADWQAVATSLFDALPKARTKAETGTAAAPGWFAEYALPKHFKLDSLDVIFADGVSVRVNVITGKGMLPRVGTACRRAVDFYRARIGASVVPAMRDVRIVRTDEAFDASACSDLTAEYRAAPPAMTPRDLGKLSPVPALNGPDGETAVQRAERIFGGRWYLNADGNVLRSHKAPGLVWDGEIEQYGSDAEYAAGALAGTYRKARKDGLAAWATDERAAARLAFLEAREAAWCEAVAGSYGDCLPCEIPGTFETLAELSAYQPGPSHETVGALNAIPAPIAETREAVAVIAEPESDVWAPTEATHPVIAYCLSEKAWHALRDRVQDGTFPAPAGAAKFGAWRLTLADAQDLQDVGSIRFAGMPRKPYTRRGAVPVAPVSAFVRIHAGAAFMASNPPSPATLHAPSV
jgi:hypothetical protein